MRKTKLYIHTHTCIHNCIEQCAAGNYKLQFTQASGVISTLCSQCHVEEVRAHQLSTAETWPHCTGNKLTLLLVSSLSFSVWKREQRSELLLRELRGRPWLINPSRAWQHAVLDNHLEMMINNVSGYFTWQKSRALILWVLLRLSRESQMGRNKSC